MRSLIVLPILIIFLTIPLLSENDSLIYLRFSDARSLDPGKTTIQYSGEVVSNIFQGLIRYKRGTYTLEPCLARKWQMKDQGKRWIFFLRKGVEFHDQTKFDARSVVYSFKKRMELAETEYPKWKLFFPYITEVRAVDKYIVEISLSKPFAPFLTALTDPVAFIIANGSLNKSEFKPVGTGPYKLKNWIKGKSIFLDRNDNYWEGKVRISKVIFKIISNPTLRVNQLKSGRADVIEIRSAYENTEFVGRKDINIYYSQLNSTFFLGFNTRKKPFNRVEVRRAFAHLIDKEILIKQTFQNMAIAAVSPLPPHILGYDKNLKHHPFDLRRARQLLIKTGLESGFTCKLYFLKGDVGEQKIADTFARNARQVNIRIIKKPYPFEILLEKLKQGEPDLYIRGWVAGPDPDIYLYSNFTLKKGNSNWALYDNPVLEDLLQKAREMMNTEKRERLYKKALAIIHKQVPWIPLYHLRYLTVCKKNIKNIYLDTNTYIIFKDAYRD